MNCLFCISNASCLTVGKKRNFVSYTQLDEQDVCFFCIHVSFSLVTHYANYIHPYLLLLLLSFEQTKDEVEEEEHVEEVEEAVVDAVISVWITVLIMVPFFN